MLQVEHLTRRYGPVTAVDDLSFEISEVGVYGFLGPNGAGKSTTMNIMLVSVTERTREIGIRKALGAREGAILRQFVIEAATTSALGGILGILLGFGLSAAATTVIANVIPDTPITVSPSAAAVVIAFGVSAGIGIVFGYLPAKKAAALNPIDALRYD